MARLGLRPPQSRPKPHQKVLPCCQGTPTRSAAAPQVAGAQLRVGYRPAAAEGARRAWRGCLTAPQTLPEGDLISVRLTNAQLSQSARPGSALLHLGDGNHTAITVPDL
jgi:hypothetical protein